MFRRRKKKFIKIVAPIILSMIAGFAVVYFALRPPPVEIRDFTVIDSHQISQIIIRQDMALTYLLKTDNGWVLNNVDSYPVDADLVNQLLRNLETSVNLGIKAWGEKKIVESGLLPDRAGILRLQLRNSNNQIMHDWLIGETVGDGQYLARAEKSDQIIHWQMATKPSADARHWLSDLWMGLDKADFQSITVAAGEVGVIQLQRQNLTEQAWKIVNLPENQHLRADSPIVRLPNLWSGQIFTTARPIASLSINNSERHRHEFFSTDGVTITIIQAKNADGIWYHFMAASANLAKQQWVDQFNAKHSAWAYQMPAGFVQLLAARMENIVDSVPASAQ